jgi:hypothetical protein
MHAFAADAFSRQAKLLQDLTRCEFHQEGGSATIRHSTNLDAGDSEHCIFAVTSMSLASASDGPAPQQHL